jgi:methionyl-tRNA formyltransferase
MSVTPTAAPVRVAFLGDRDVARRSLELLQQRDDTDIVLLGVSGPDRASHADALRALCPEGIPVLVGDALRSDQGRGLLEAARPDIVLSVHFPYLIPDAALSAATIGAYNLHPGLLPHGRGWHTVSWALLEGAPIGCTLHRMTTELDRGPIVAQQEVAPVGLETAHELYQRVLATEVDLLATMWPDVRSWPQLERAQPDDAPPTRSARDLFAHPDRDLASRDVWPTEHLLRALRAFTTNDPTEALEVSVDGAHWRLRIERADGADESSA